MQEKRPDLLLHAASKLRQHYKGLRVVFAGQQRIPYESTWPRLGGLVTEVTTMSIESAVLGVAKNENVL